jgi:hypothetical protein
MQKTVTLALLALLVACSRHSSATDSWRLYELQTSCGSSARDWFRTIHGKDTVADTDTQDFANHYSQKFHRCYLIWSESHARTSPYSVNQLVDVNENASIGYYMQRLNDEKPTRCEVDAKRCQSSKEWTDLVTPYLHE